MIDWRKALDPNRRQAGNDCPRCGSDCMSHANIRLFTVPVEQAGFVAGAWAMCRVLREPVLIGVQKPWWWVRVFRWQLAYIWKKQIQTVERLVPIYSNMYSWSGEPETSTAGAACASYVVKFDQYGVTPSVLREKPNG